MKSLKMFNSIGQWLIGIRSHLKNTLFVIFKAGCHSERVEEYRVGNNFTLRQAQGDLLIKD